MSFRLHSGEEIVYRAHPNPRVMANWYVLTLGLFEFWRRAATVTLTNQRVVLERGLARRRRRAVPVLMVQDAQVSSQGRRAWVVVVASAGVRPAVLELGPFALYEADDLTDLILAQQRAARRPASE